MTVISTENKPALAFTGLPVQRVFPPVPDEILAAYIESKKPGGCYTKHCLLIVLQEIYGVTAEHKIILAG